MKDSAITRQNVAYLVLGQVFTGMMLLALAWATRCTMEKLYGGSQQGFLNSWVAILAILSWPFTWLLMFYYADETRNEDAKELLAVLGAGIGGIQLMLCFGQLTAIFRPTIILRSGPAAPPPTSPLVILGVIMAVGGVGYLVMRTVAAVLRKRHGK